MARYGMPLCAIAARQRNPLINAWLDRQYGSIEVLTREVMALLDDTIKKTPEQWFWYNKRWLLQPVKKRRHKKASTAPKA